jgi:catechol 2,3-dioxygenase-like lactoylglutathione lyase family enzyme
VRLHHVGIACLDLADARASLQAMGLGVPQGEPVMDEARGVLLQLLRAPDGVLLELVQGPSVEALAKKGQVLYHSCWEVDSLAQASQALVAGGARPLGEPAPAPLFQGRLVAFFATPAGIVELLEAAP